MKTTLVTGSAGYVGAHTVLFLKEHGYRVLGFDNLSTGCPDFVALADTFVHGDVTDPAAIARAFDRHEIDSVVHCAALALVGESVDQPEAYYRVNVGGTALLLAEMRRRGVSDFAFSSTAATYGEPAVDVITEETPQRPINPYGESKLAVEQMLWAAQRAWGLRPVVFRYFNAAGADPRGRAGEDREVETHLIPNMLRPLAEGRAANTFTIFGDDYPTPDGTCVRDYIHVCDLAIAHELALRYLRGGGLPDAFNLGTGHGYSVRQVVDAAAGVLGRPIPFRLGKRRPGDPARLVTSFEKAQRVLGWRPAHSDLAAMVESAWAWHQARHGSSVPR